VLLLSSLKFGECEPERFELCGHPSNGNLDVYFFLSEANNVFSILFFFPCDHVLGEALKGNVSCIKAFSW